MHNLLAATMFTFLSVSFGVLAEVPTPSELQPLADQTDQIWNKRDGSSLADFYSTDATLTISGRQITLEGKAKIEDYFVNSLAKVPADLRHQTRVDQVHQVSDQQILVDNTVYLYRETQGKSEKVAKFITLTLLEKTETGYKFKAVRAIPVTLEQNQ